MYKINPTAYTSVFVLPTDIADKHLRMAGKAQLKVLLWLFRNQGARYDLSVISRDTGIPADEIDDAMLYWVEAGLVLDSEKNNDAPIIKPTAETVKKEPFKSIDSAPAKTETEPEPPATPKKPVIIKPSQQDIARRMNESPEIKEMMIEIEQLIGRTLGFDALSSLLILHDYHGLAPEAIVILFAYAKTMGKQGNFAYINKIGASWGEMGITTFDLATERVAKMEKSDKLWPQFREFSGIENPKPTTKQSEYFYSWVNDFSFSLDVIEYAYEKGVEKKGSISFSYINGILRSWFEKGYKSLSDVTAAEAEFAKSVENSSKPNKKTPKAEKSTRSYSVELALKKSMELDPTKTKKGQ